MSDRAGTTQPDVGLPHAALEGLRVAELEADDAARVQAFYDANPAYFHVVSGAPAESSDGRDDLLGLPPADWPWTRRWYLGWSTGDGKLAAVADVTSDLLAESVWHLGLFIVETARHGRGDAQRLHAAIEQWAHQGGARWMRLGVVSSNARAAAFWQRQGYVEVRRREGIEFGAVTRTVVVMVKPLSGGSIDEYLARVARDRPDAP